MKKKRILTQEEMLAVKSYIKSSSEKIGFSSKDMVADNFYVAWVDIMGARYLMENSMQKAANVLARLHASVRYSIDESNASSIIIPVNDGVFIIEKDKKKVMEIMQRVMCYLVGRFIETNNQMDRFMFRSGISFGPVVVGDEVDKYYMNASTSAKKCLSGVAFGPAISKAYEAEGKASPFGVYIDISARSFCNSDDGPFQISHWLWWNSINKNNHKTFKGMPSLVNLKNALLSEIDEYFEFLIDGEIFLEIGRDKIKKYQEMARQYLNA